MDLDLDLDLVQCCVKLLKVYDATLIFSESKMSAGWQYKDLLLAHTISYPSSVALMV